MGVNKHKQPEKSYEESFSEATQEDFERLWSRVAIAGQDECWLWKNRYGAVLDRHEEPKIYIKNKEWRPSRFIMMAENEQVTPTSQVAHVCGTYSCVNPAHLHVGTSADRARLMVQNGRQARGKRSGHYTKPEATPRGEAHGSAKLSEVQVVAIRQRFAAGGITLADLGRQYGVNYRTISVIVHRKKWKHL